MEIYVGYLESVYDECETELEEKLAETKIQVIKEKAKKDNRVFIDGDYVYMIGDLSKELDISFTEPFSTYVQAYDCGDWIKLEGIEIQKRDCINLLKDKILTNDELTVKTIERIFSNEENEKCFIYGLIDSQVKHVVLDKIIKLQKLLVEEYNQVSWK